MKSRISATWPAVFFAFVLANAPATKAVAVTFTAIDFPGAGNSFDQGTVATGISGSNVVGYYNEPSGREHGFLYDGLGYIALDAPGAIGTTIWGISGRKIVGAYYSEGFVAHGFLYDGTSWTTLDYHDAGTGIDQGTILSGVSGDTIVGTYTDSSGTNHGLVYRGGVWTVLDHPLADRGTVVLGIDGSRIVGSYSDGIYHGFMYDGSSWTTIDAPDSNRYTFINGISGNNIAGYYNDTSYTADNHGFLYDGTTWTDIDHPSAIRYVGLTKTTLVYGVEGDNVVGAYYGQAYSGGYPVQGVSYHGFLATVPEPSALVLEVIGAVTLGVGAKRIQSLGVQLAGADSRPEALTRVNPAVPREPPQRSVHELFVTESVWLVGVEA